MDQREFKKRLGDLAAGKITHDEVLKDLHSPERKPPSKSANEPTDRVGKKAAPAIKGLFDGPAEQGITAKDTAELRAAFAEVKQSFSRLETLFTKILGPG